MTYHVYMLKSLGKKSVTYVGHTNNLRKRILFTITTKEQNLLGKKMETNL